MDQQNITTIVMMVAVIFLFYVHMETKFDELRKDVLNLYRVPVSHHPSMDTQDFQLGSQDAVAPPDQVSHISENPVLNQRITDVIPTREELQARLNKNSFYAPIENSQNYNCFPNELGTYDISQVQPYDPVSHYMAVS